MAHYDLDDLLDSLNEVAADSDPDSDDDRDPDDEDSNDPSDDRNDIWDREQGEENEQDDGSDNDDGDYSGSRRAVMLLKKLNSEADRWTLEQHRARAKQPKKPIGKVDQKKNMIAALRQKTAQINLEMETDKLLAAEEKQHLKASVALYLANRSPAERHVHEADMQRLANYYSSVCKEASPTWREDATAEFS